MNRDAQPVLVTGATGFVGRHLVQRLCEEGRDRVRVFIRNRQKVGVFQGLPVDVVVGDLADEDHVAAAADGVEVIYHLAAAKDVPWAEHVRGTIRGTANVVRATLRQPGTRLVHMSSLAVYGIPSRSQRVLSEDAPYADSDVTVYARAKIEAEQIVRGAVARQGLAATILRPGIIYGPGSSVTLSKIGCRIGDIFFVVGMRAVTLPLVYIGNVVEAILLAGRTARGCGQIYHVVDDDCPTQTDYIRRLNAAGPVHYAYMRVPYAVAAAVGWTARRLGRYQRTLASLGATLSPLHLRSCTTELVFDTSKIKRELGWQPDTRIEEHLRRTCAAAGVDADRAFSYDISQQGAV